MNFDIKNIKNLKLIDFIKIKQFPSIILGAQSQGTFSQVPDLSGCKLEMFNKQTDRWDPFGRDRKEKEKEKRKGAGS